MFRTGENVGGKLLNKNKGAAATKGADSTSETATDVSGLMKKPSKDCH